MLWQPDQLDPAPRPDRQRRNAVRKLFLHKLDLRPEPRNPSDHLPCTTLFNLSETGRGSLVHSVFESQRGLFRTFSYPACCGENVPRAEGETREQLPLI